MKEQQFKIPGYEYQERNTGTPLTDGAEFALHLGNPDLKAYTDVAINAALNTMPVERQLGLFEKQPGTLLEEADLNSLKIETFRRAEAAGVIEIDDIAVGAMTQVMTREKFAQAA